MSGTPRSAAESQARENFSPTTLPIEPPMNAKSMTASSQPRPSIAAWPITIASAEPGLHLGLGEPLGVRAQVEEVERILGVEVGRLLDERARVGERVDPRARAHREVMAALRADPERRLELVVAVVRVAARAGVRVLRRRGRLVVGLDGDVDFGHVASLDRGPRRGVAAAAQRPRAAVSRSSFSTFAGSQARGRSARRRRRCRARGSAPKLPLDARRRSARPARA